MFRIYTQTMSSSNISNRTENRFLKQHDFIKYIAIKVNVIIPNELKKKAEKKVLLPSVVQNTKTNTKVHIKIISSAQHCILFYIEPKGFFRKSIFTEFNSWSSLIRFGYIVKKSCKSLAFVPKFFTN